MFSVEHASSTGPEFPQVLASVINYLLQISIFMTYNCGWARSINYCFYVTEELFMEPQLNVIWLSEANYQII